MAAQSLNFVTDAEVEAILSAYRVLVAVSARTGTAERQVLDPAQFRFLVVLSARDVSSLEELATVTGLSMATASRVYDRMMRAGLIDRDDEAHPSEGHLRLTERGRDLLRAGMSRRCEALEAILGRLPPLRRLELVAVLREFAAAGDEAMNGCRVGAEHSTSLVAVPDPRQVTVPV